MSFFLVTTKPDQILSTDKKKRILYKDVEFITKGFQQQIGEGGFGPVYYGKLSNGQEVAAKLLSKLSHQGSEEFYNEVCTIKSLIYSINNFLNTM